MLHVDVVWLDILPREFFDKCLGACENLIRGLERPAVQLIVNSHPRVSGCISMVKCDPPSRMIQAGPPHQKMRLHTIGPDEVDIPLCYERTQLGDDLAIESPSLEDDIMWSADVPDRFSETILALPSAERYN